MNHLALKEPGKKTARPSDTLEAVQRRLLLVRLELDKNRTRFAQQFGVHHTLWGKWEGNKGGNYPDPAVMVALCERYGLTLDLIYRGILKNVPHHKLALRLARHPEFLVPDMAAPEDN